jgi:hypothetical protein
MESKIDSIKKMLPWGAGAGFATGHMMLTSQCTIVTLGLCTGCAGCAVALVSLVSWGALKDRPPKQLNHTVDE